METAPTTAYLMLRDGCERKCAFCTQARDSGANQALLSRVNWPAFALEDVVHAIARAHSDRQIARACFQVTMSGGYLDRTRDAVAKLASTSGVPICASVVARRLEDVESLLAAGAERVTLALDAASPAVYARVKGGSWVRAWSLLEAAARRFPGHVGTHLIVGLGETERDMVALLKRLLDLEIAVGLFAFTPVPGTGLANGAPPELYHYRRMQGAFWLLAHGLAKADAFAYNHDHRVVSLGLAPEELVEVLGQGEAFRTSDRLGCNRPYYNERPGGVMFNYPRPLTSGEAQMEIAALIESLEAGADA